MKLNKLKNLLFVNILLFPLSTLPVYSQDGVGSWNITNLKINIDEQWSLMGEAQLRSLKFYDHFHYYEFKTALNYNIDKNFSTSIGIGKYNTFSEGGNFLSPLQSDEVRTFGQLTMKQYLSFLKFDHRYRAEQRFTTKGYRNRFRYRLNLTVPINKLKIETGTIYLNTWDEIFLTDQGPHFERNRLFMGIGYQLNDNLIVQTGYIYQFDFKLNDEIGRDFLQVSLQYELDILNKEKYNQEHIPGLE